MYMLRNLVGSSPWTNVLVSRDQISSHNACATKCLNSNINGSRGYRIKKNYLTIVHDVTGSSQCDTEWKMEEQRMYYNSCDNIHKWFLNSIRNFFCTLLQFNSGFIVIGREGECSISFKQKGRSFGVSSIWLDWKINLQVISDVETRNPKITRK